MTEHNQPIFDLRPGSSLNQTFKILNVGCGPARNRLPPPFNEAPWQEIRLDIDPNVQPDILASITDLSEVPTNSVDAIYSSHSLEHLYAHEIGTALREFSRVLNPNGFAIVFLPDLYPIAEMILQGRLHDTAYMSPAGPISAFDMLYGFQPAVAAGNQHMCHRSGFTAESLEQALKNAGFPAVSVRQDGRWYLWGVASMNPNDLDATAMLAANLVTGFYSREQ